MKTVDFISVTPYYMLVIIILLFFAVLFFGKFYFRNDYNKNTDQVKPFDSGNTDETSGKIQSSNLYWGFREAFKPYYSFVENLHDGNLNSFVKWLIVTSGLCFILISGGML